MIADTVLLRGSYATPIQDSAPRVVGADGTPPLRPSRARPGGRVKTDKRDAVRLARLLAAGDLTLVAVPPWSTSGCAIWCAVGRICGAI
jgi:hypothetical protein